jgi:hypothetical protein
MKLGSKRTKEDATTSQYMQRLQAGKPSPYTEILQAE